MWPFRCLSPSCQASGAAHSAFYLPVREPKHAIKSEDESLSCPDCKSKGYLYRVENIHLLIHDPKGLVAGSDIGPFRGTSSNFFSPACGKGKAIIAEHGGQWPIWFKMTTLPEAATCFDCNEYLSGVKLGGVAKGGLWLPLEVSDRVD